MDALQNPTPLVASSWATIDEAGIKRRLALIGTIDGLVAQEKFLEIEPVFGLLSGSDVHSLLPHAKDLAVGLLGIGAFVRALRERMEDHEKEQLAQEEVGPDEKQLSHLKETSYQYVPSSSDFLILADSLH